MIKKIWLKKSWKSGQKDTKLVYAMGKTIITFN